jgi:hypothetical protein
LNARLRRAVGLLALSVLLCSCRRQEPEPAASDESGAPQPKSPDRLAPGKLLEGDQVSFGFRAPRDLKLVAQFYDAAHFEGQVKLADLEDYVRERVVSRHVEVTPGRSVFPNVVIRGGDPKRTYRFELVPKGVEMQLVIRDVTPPPPTQGLDEQERWKRAGVTRQGKRLVPTELE